MKLIQIRDIKTKPRVFRGRKIEPENRYGVWNADITKDTIRIFGTQNGSSYGPVEFDRVFTVGDRVEYDSYNLHYLGVIEAIGPSSVTIAERGERKTRLGLFEFIWRNWNLDLGRIEKHNDEELMCI
jgi:hypothetical protein